MEGILIGNSSLYPDVAKNLSKYLEPDGYIIKSKIKGKEAEFFITRKSIWKLFGLQQTLIFRMRANLWNNEIEYAFRKLPFKCCIRLKWLKTADIMKRVLLVARNTFEMEEIYGKLVYNVPIFDGFVPLYPIREQNPSSSLKKCVDCSEYLLNFAYRSPREYWRNLSGREGYLPICPKCGRQYELVITMMN